MTCKQASELASRELDVELPFRHRVGLQFHVLLCGSCRRFRRQLSSLDREMNDLLADPEIGSNLTLSPGAREAMNARIQQEMNQQP